MKETQDNNNGAAAAESVKAQTINNDVDRASIITQDRLKKFNEINGYENGPATEELEQEEDEIQDEQSNPNEGINEETKDEVHGLNENDEIRRKSASRLAKIRPKLQKSTLSSRVSET